MVIAIKSRKTKQLLKALEELGITVEDLMNIKKIKELDVQVFEAMDYFRQEEKELEKRLNTIMSNQKDLEAKKTYADSVKKAEVEIEVIK